MTPKEKAEDLVNRFDMIIYTDQDHDSQVKRCALVAVDEMLKHDEKIIVSHKTSAYKSFEDFNQNLKHIQNELDSYVLSRYSYWQEVKQEIIQL